jgi:5-oxoprolinase (ATP-hydrolysing)
MLMSGAGSWDFWIDTGGTFTDCLGRDPSGNWHRAKVLSNSSLRATIVTAGVDWLKVQLSENYPEDFFAGFRIRFPNSDEDVSVVGFNADESKLFVKGNLPEAISEGDLVVFQYEGEAPELGARLITRTPALIPLPPSRLRLATTRGTNALLERKGARTALFIDKGLRDLLRINTQQRPDLFALKIVRPKPMHDAVVEVEFDRDGELKDEKSFRQKVIELKEQGIVTAAVCLMHSYQNGSKEKKLSRFLQDLEMTTVVASHECAPFIKILPRAETTLVDASLSPVLNTYLDRIAEQFGEAGLSIMTSSGGLVPRASFRPKDSLFSGPAGGVVGAVGVGARLGIDKVIGFDMGGTSTDVSRYHGALAYQFETRVGDARVMAPSLKIATVAAGGGSICQYDGERLRVGPESAGASPGPACYGTGGPLTVTDVNLLLGRMDAAQFGIPVDVAHSRKRLEELMAELGSESGDALLAGLLEIANENMADAIRKISTGEGYDPAGYTLVAFGGAGGQHACGIAEKLGMKTVLFPGDAGLLSAAGLSRAVLEGFAEKQLLCSYPEWEMQADEVEPSLKEEALAKLNPGDRDKARECRRILSLRLKGQEMALDVDWIPGQSPLQKFVGQYRTIFGYEPGLESVEVVCFRVVVSTPSAVEALEQVPECDELAIPLKSQAAFSGGKFRESKIYVRRDLAPGSRIEGPAIIQDPFSTLFIDVGWNAKTGSAGTLQLDYVGAQMQQRESTEEVEIELFSNRFQALVEEMGERLKRTAISTNVKDRLDFSCGLLDAQGGLVVNAPHIPVHLGALGTCVRTVGKIHTWQPGEMLVTNHPGFGGSHLPDVTVICPVFSDVEDLIGFLVNRAHHAEMGGIAPGSMPPAAKSLAEEGVVIPPMPIMRNGVVDLDAIKAVLTNGPYPSRRVDENLADMKAQVAANLKGLEDFRNLIGEHGNAKIVHYMKSIQDRAEKSLRRKLAELADGKYHAIQKLDDGTPLEVVAQVEGDSMTLSFSDGGGVHSGNYNATPGIVYSAVIYFLRVWLDEPMPLNEGLLRPVRIKIAQGLLNPPFPQDPGLCPPVVAGNVETSQRLVDTLFLAFEVAACSQGTMNNLIFGNERISFYETIAGGAGAGGGFCGESGVHTHMTNTGITDPEILEYRFPVKLREFSLRRGSGGGGKFRGGDGVVRELEFTEAVNLSLLTQHRLELPYGLKGGHEGMAGEQWLLREGNTPVKLKPTDSLELFVGDRLRILTPGGGGWGEQVLPH